MSDIFGKFAPFIQDYIYNSGWENLREVQTQAAKVLFDTENHLLLTSQTASGKTEAAFFPIISMMYEDEPQSVGVLYIAPLKSLINDQFYRLDEILDESSIPVFHWHGDVGASHKNKLLKNPRGILQITPESLESMLMNRSNDIVRLFCDLRFIVVDEIHILTGSDRGNQIICQLDRLCGLIGRDVRRVGLSATVGDVDSAAKWLCGNSARPYSAPIIKEGRTSWKLGMEHFYIQNQNIEQTQRPLFDKNIQDSEKIKYGKPFLPSKSMTTGDPGYDYVYECIKKQKGLVFSNSREQTEYITATLRQIAKRRNEKDVFLIHHGNLSASIREEVEQKMKDDEQQAVTCATVTLELGVDIGRLERVVQIDSPNSVSAFLQRLGRSGRRGEAPQMIMVFREEEPLAQAPMPKLIPWELIRAVAIVQLYIEQRFIEPPSKKKMPFSLLFQQTLSVLASAGELEVKQLAERVLSMPPFELVQKEDYKAILISMIKNDFLEMTEEKTLIIGLKGERLINNYRFYAVFKDEDDYSVRCDSDEIGTITSPPPVGDRFALAGRVWEVVELDISRKLIYVKGVEGKMEISWPGDYGEIHTKILERMRLVLAENTMYPYLKQNARSRLDIARHIANNGGVPSRCLISLGGMTYCLFPWLGTRSFRTLRKLLTLNAERLGICGIEYEGCCFITFKYENGNIGELIEKLHDICSEPIDTLSLVSKSEVPLFEKYDAYIPHELLRKAYAADRLRTDELVERINEIYDDYLRGIYD